MKEGRGGKNSVSIIERKRSKGNEEIYSKKKKIKRHYVPTAPREHALRKKKSGKTLLKKQGETEGAISSRLFTGNWLERRKSVRGERKHLG